MKLRKAALACLCMFAMPAFSASVVDDLNLGGSIRANYSLKFFDEDSKDKKGDFAFDVMTLTLNGKIEGIGIDFEYRFNSWEHFVRKAYVYYDLDESWQVQLGINQVPFGNSPYISNSWWFGLPYYMGFEDDFDAGVKAIYKDGAHTTDIAFYKSAEYGPTETKRYAGDLYSGTVNGKAYTEEESNQVNLRHRYEMSYEDIEATIGASLELGQNYYSQFSDTRNRTAFAVHADIAYQDWGGQAQVIKYDYNGLSTEDRDYQSVAISLYGGTYEVADEGVIYSLNLKKSFKWNGLDFTVYNDFGYMEPEQSGEQYDASSLNVTGVSIAKGPLFVYVDLISAKNMPFFSFENNSIGLKQNNQGRDERFNINIGYYF